VSASNDCPACPKCTLRCGTRVGPWASIAVARSRSVEHLACSACGHVWRAEADALVQASRADRAWLREQAIAPSTRAT
jgi:transcription elongation factor Elf1